MSKFRVGDVCVGQNLVVWPECNGMECVVTQINIDNEWCDYRTGVEGYSAINYSVRWADGSVSNQEARTLRLKRPPSWDQFIYSTDKLDSEVGERREVSSETPSGKEGEMA